MKVVPLPTTTRFRALGVSSGLVSITTELACPITAIEK